MMVGLVAGIVDDDGHADGGDGGDGGDDHGGGGGGGGDDCHMIVIWFSFITSHIVVFDAFLLLRYWFHF